MRLSKFLSLVLCAALLGSSVAHAQKKDKNKSNPLAPPSPYDFDWYSREAVNFTIENDALARGLPAEEAKLDLAAKIHALALRMALPEQEAA